MSRLAAGIDVGATSIKAGLIDDAGRILFSTSVATPPRSATGGTVVAAIIAAAERVRAEARTRGVELAGFGFGVPEYSVGSDWVQMQSGNIPALEGIALRRPLSQAFGDVIACDLDTHAATTAELTLGAGIGCRRLIFVGMGTGISCGIVVDGELLRFTFGTSGDTGHLVVDPEGTRPCTCGGRGCLETYAGGWAIARAGRDAAASGDSGRLAKLA